MESPALAWSTSKYESLLPALEWLDRLLQRAVAVAQTIYGPGAATDAFRGLYLQLQDVQQLLGRQPGASHFQNNGYAVEDQWPDASPTTVWQRQLNDEFSLTAFDLRVLVIALAPELDLRYERLYAYLQDDVSRKRPSVDLALNLLCPTAEARLGHFARFMPDAPLLRHGLIHLIAEPSQAPPPLLAQALKLDESVLRLVLEIEGLDSRLVSFCTLDYPVSATRAPSLPETTQRTLEKLTIQACENRQRFLVHFLGSPHTQKRRCAESMASAAGMSLLVVDLTRSPVSAAEWQTALVLLLRAARRERAVLYLEGFDSSAAEQHAPGMRCLLEHLRYYDGIAILAGAEAWPSPSEGPSEALHIYFGVLATGERRACWKAEMSANGLAPDSGQIDFLAARYRLTAGQIGEAVAIACQQARWNAAQQGRENGTPLPGLREFCAAAKSQTSTTSTGLWRRIEPQASWDDLVLPPSLVTLLRDLCNQARLRSVVLEDWGFDRKLSLGKGLVALFSGPPGTGKTFAAEVIANDLDLELYKIDLAQVVSKYIGETEKNLDRVFRAAERAKAILLFDEADTLFGQRSQVRDAHDRYANIEVGYLLQRMEEYEGVAILATNLAGNMDSAFVRRLTFRIEFPLPHETYRQRIWRQMFTEAAPRSPDLDFCYLARQFNFAGGNIKNVVLAASFLAAAEQQPIGMKHLVRAIFREFQKMGKTCAAADFGEYASLGDNGG